MNDKKTNPVASKSPQEMLVSGSMQPADFRIGNLVRSKQWRGIGEIEGIEVLKDRIDFKSKGYVHSLEKGKYFDLEPIPITKEWLERFGFKKVNKNLSCLPVPSIKAEIHYETHSYGNVITMHSDFGMFLPNDIEYVHQLQNLYFALTGKELEFDR